MIFNKTTEKRCWKTIGVYGDMSCPELNEYIHCRNCPVFTNAGRELFNNSFVSNELLDDWTIKNASAKDTEIIGDFSIVPFRLYNEWFALATKFLIGANEVLPVHSVPHRTNNIFKGLVNINGELLCCISAYEVLGLESVSYNENKKKGYERMLIIKKDNDVFVFKVDELLRAKKIKKKKLQKPPATLLKSFNSYTNAVFIDDDNTVGVIDEETFFKTIKESLNRG